MAYNKKQFRDVITTTLQKYDLNSRSAVNLLLGTAAQESELGTHFRQIGGGPALSAFQIEPATFYWLRDSKYEHLVSMEDRQFEELVTDLDLAIYFARRRYRMVAAPLPPADDVTRLGRYWKQHFNTPAGAGTVEQFVASYELHLGLSFV